MKLENIVDEFVNNRAEQLDADVTNEFIVPHYFDKLTLHRDRKSVRVIGGRGCGKTIFLRYFSHCTQLSVKQSQITSDVFSQGIGLYWRTDTGFCDLMKPEWLGEEQAYRAFLHYIAIVVLEEVALFINNLAKAPLSGEIIDLRMRQLPASTEILLSKKVGTYADLRDFAKTRRFELSRWVQNPGTDAPLFLRIDEVLSEIAEDIAEADARLRKIFFRIFVDEFENLKDNQRQLVCDLVKHPRPRYSFNFAMRKDSVDQFVTSGGEQIVETHDIRSIDLEKLVSENERTFKLLAAELLLMKLAKQGFDAGCPEFEVNRLHAPSRLHERIDEGYIRAIRAAAGRLLPGRSAADIAKGVFDDAPLLRRLTDVATKGLQKHRMTRLSAAQFQCVEQPVASIVAAFVLNRDKPGPQAVLDALDSFGGRSGPANPFNDWESNNLHGALFYLYDGLPNRANPLYAGFDRYCQMSAPNLRFFLEFCHTALRDVTLSPESRVSGDLQCVPWEVQALAAKDTSSVLLKDIPNLGLRGRDLQMLVKRLGRLFQTAHRRASLSEPEINHFSIDEADKEALSDATRSLLREALIWSVLYEEKDTKNKSDSSLAQHDYIPNPIFSAYFGISYRKRKKITLKASEINVIFSGSDAHFETLLRSFMLKWDQTLAVADAHPGLFE
ncbi:hypothetical protein HDC36_004102 [Xanthomonas sp. JAI131]|uniref:ORC-CDC6 family AAA ATPase n=1 Tax=Xanthomonas sp. JAI131 TaxID=2723067 RepID=UPI0015CCAE9C|nr:hypothetical protein [Xanthomonas sp. JAI131]NYF22625.1 hypothetical protein [Xanthomonas sp. JAI131]